MSENARAEAVGLRDLMAEKKDDVALLKAEIKVAARRLERLIKNNPELAAEFGPPAKGGDDDK